jgi:rod shape-determining protein MreD
VKITSVLATVLVAVLVQVLLSRFTIADRWVFDLVLVGVIYAALQWGAVAGMLAGTIGGLLHDVLSGGIAGVGGLAKTVVGFAAGGIGSQLVVAKPQGRMLIVAAASLAHRFILVGLQAMIDQQWPAVSVTALVSETLINALIGFVAFQVTESLPGAVSRGRFSRRSSLSRRNW